MKYIVFGQGNLYEHHGGGQVYVRNLIAGLLDNGHAVEYLTLALSNSTVPQLHEQTVNGVLARQLLVPDLRKNIGDGQCELTIDALALICRDIEPDIIHAHGWKELACHAANRAGIPCVVTAHHGGIVCPAGALLNHNDEICTVPAGQNICLPCCVRSIPGGKLWLPMLRLIPLDVQLRLGRWLRTRRFLYFATPLGTLALSIRDKLAAIETLGKYATRMIAPSPAIRDALVRNGVPASKVVVVSHGIPLSQRQPLRPDMEKGPVRFLYVGRISYVKGVHVLLAAFAGLPPAAYELHIVGGAVTKPDRRYLARLQQQYASVNVVWYGSRSHEEIPHHIAACDVLVHPAICLEIYGLTIAETLAVGRPVIASRCGGAEAQIRDGVNGLLVPPNDAGALRQAIQSVIANPACLQAMAKQTDGVVSIEQHVEDLKKIYTDLLSSLNKSLHTDNETNAETETITMRHSNTISVKSYEEAKNIELSRSSFAPKAILLRAIIHFSIYWYNFVLKAMKWVLFKNSGDGVNNISIYTVGTLGDNVLMLPAIAAIRRRYPSATITAITNCDGFGEYAAREIIGKSPDVDRHITLPNHPVQRRGAKLVMEFPEKDSIDCDLFVNLSPFGNRGWIGAVIREMLFAKWLGAKSAKGFKVSSYNRRGIFNSVQHYFVENEARRPRGILKELGITPVENEDLLPRDAVARERVNKFVVQHVSNQRPIFILNPGAKLKASYWPAERFGEIAAWLVKTYNACVFVNGTAGEKEVCERVVKASGGIAVSLAGELSIQELIELLRLSAACITNNTGPMTLSAMVGTPEVVLSSTRFSPTFYMPVSNKMIWLFHFNNNSYSYNDDVDVSEDLMSITTGDVIRAIKEIVAPAITSL